MLDAFPPNGFPALDAFPPNGFPALDAFPPNGYGIQSRPRSGTVGGSSQSHPSSLRPRSGTVDESSWSCPFGTRPTVGGSSWSCPSSPPPGLSVILENNVSFFDTGFSATISSKIYDAIFCEIFLEYQLCDQATEERPILH